MRRVGRPNVRAIDSWNSMVMPEPNTGCWIWAGAHTPQGYGVFEWPGVKPRSTTTAHRAGYILLRGDPGALWVLHKCDNPWCVNPDHMFLGTAADNMADMRAKGRAIDQTGKPKRRASRVVKLTDDQVRAIRKDPRHHVAIAMAYRIGVTTAYDIVKRRRKTLVPD